MVKNVELEYSIGGMGKVEKTILSGLQKEDEFRFGNNSDLIVKIVDINNEAVILKFFGLEQYNIVLPNQDDTIEIKVGNRINPYTNITPSSVYEIRVLNINSSPQLYWN